MKKLLSVLFFITVIASCKKADYVEPIITSVDYKIADSMKLNASYATSDSSFYKNYNGKIYTDKEINVTSNYTVDNDGITLQFQDANAIKGNALAIKFAGKTLDNISGVYNLSANTNVKYTYYQKFYNGTFGMIVPKPFESGSLTINYSAANKFVYGFVTDAKIFIGAYVPYQSSTAGITQTVAQASTLLTNQSSRTYNIIFNFVKQQ